MYHLKSFPSRPVVRDYERVYRGETLHLTSPLIGMWFLQRSPSGGLRLGCCWCFAQLMSNQMLLDFVKGYWWAGRGSCQSLGFPGGKRMAGWRENVNEWKKNVFYFTPAVRLCDPKHLCFSPPAPYRKLSLCANGPFGPRQEVPHALGLTIVRFRSPPI